MDVILFSERLRRVLAGEEGTMLDGAKEQIHDLQSEIEIMVSFLKECQYKFEFDDLFDSDYHDVLSDSDCDDDLIDSDSDFGDDQEDDNVDKHADDNEENDKRDDEEDEEDAHDKVKEDHFENKDDDQGKDEEGEEDADDKGDLFEDKEDGEDADDGNDEKAVKRKLLRLIRKMVFFVRKCEKAIDTCIINTLLQLQHKTATESNCKKLLLALHDLQRKLSPKIKRRIQQILQLRSTQNQAHHSSSSSGTVQSDGERELINSEPGVEGLEDKMEELLDLLVEGGPQLSFIGIGGDTELENTTLAVQAYNSNYVKNYFDCHAWVLVAAENNPEKILDDIMKCVMPSPCLSEIPEKNFDQKKTTLRDYLSSKRYLIVLDDVWDTDIWDDLKEALPDLHNRSRVLTTLGDMDILRKFSFENGKKFSFDDGIPFTGPVKLTYEDLHFIILNVGRKTLEENCHRYSDENVQRVQMDSYFSLPFYLKPCFLYLAVFNKGIEIATRHLYQLWIAEGFIHDNDVATAKKYLEELIDRGLLQVKKRRDRGEIKTCYLPTIEWLASIVAAGMVEFMTNYRLDQNTCRGSKFYSIQREPGHFVSSKHSGPYLRSLLCLISIGDHPTDCNYISKNFKLLRVLDLGTLILEQCPHGIENLLLLRYLKLNIPSLTTIPSSLCNLLNLFTLGMPSSKIYHTPEDIWKLVKLKHLNFYFINLPAHPGKCYKSLEDLNFISVLHASSCTRDIFGGLPNLQSLRIFGNLSSYQSVMSNSLSELLCLESLKLVNETNISQHSSIILGEYQFPPSLTQLSLSNTELKDDPMPTLEKLPHLQVLKLKHKSYSGRKLFCSPGGFPSLKILHLKSMLWLDEWTMGTGAMSELEFLIINPCAYLRKLPEELWRIKTFSKLELWWPQPELKQRLRGVEDMDQYDIQIYPFGV